MKILIIEDDRFLQEGLQLALQQEGYASDCAGSMREAENLMETAPYSLVILDLGLPDGDGMSLLVKWRKKGNDVPVLILTARDGLDQRVSGLNFGADDYLIKPFALAELLARARAVIRRHQGVSNNYICVDNISLDLNSHEVTVNGSPIDITPKEFAILSRLMLRAGHRIHREILHQDLYNWDDDPSSNSLEVHIHNLRQKIGKDRIRTLRGFGYLLIKENGENT
ncbi:two-component system response regulator PmrA [Sodalis ligni]|jgi:two-component system response regulator BasR|uniref:Two-component system response regulator BasR n=1 Tax=Sodalis ligni TaxID=2697027 RepID=A0A4R1NJI4_9GAMM|nr:two-component system response regulator PmrA [Sodalis ligni]QWA09393.1 two-component system response regulator PmrA [Sodalis ligni]TCL07297.1 two-component system response regulator BasR [Sodalis ligni]